MAGCGLNLDGNILWAEVAPPNLAAMSPYADAAALNPCKY